MRAGGTTLRTVTATRYVLPLREGGSLPGLLEADDFGTYVVKFHGAGQGRKALVAEVVVGELARALGLRVPELVLVRLDPELARGEPDQEIQDLLRASAGVNLGVDYLPGSLGYDPIAEHVDPELAAAIVWLDALTLNVDRSWRNPNLLRWHRDLYLIDHGAALYFHHDWPTAGTAPGRAYPVAAEHVLLRAAGSLHSAHERLAAYVTPDSLTSATGRIPDDWLRDEAGFADPDEVRRAYVDLLLRRRDAAQAWLPRVEEARAASI